MVEPAAISEHDPIFKWETMKEVGPFELRYKDRTVAGTTFELELTCGEKVRVWRAEDAQEYFCHGLTFGGTAAPGGAVSPLSDHVPTILREHYEAIPETHAMAGDILVWRGASADDVVHSAILIDAVVSPGVNLLDYATSNSRRAVDSLEKPTWRNQIS